ncbi:MAG: hypothetical protein JKX94_02950 [Sneathiella sp.]|nr:hypothetical protein [Sneathiella sp.]
MMRDAIFQSDCDQCAALCCVALPFDKSDFFAFDKKGGEACLNLNGRGRCTIHDELRECGFSGCIQYDCLGAGQRVTQEIFDGQSWQDQPVLLKPMSDAFRAMRVVQELRQLLSVAEKLPLSTTDLQQFNQLYGALSPTEGWSYASLMAFEKSDVPKKANTFFNSLQRHVTRPPELQPAG